MAIRSVTGMPLRHAPPRWLSTGWFWTEVALLRDRWDVLRHPFYRRWSAGGLTLAELQVYATEYHHAVVAITVASRHAAEQADAALATGLHEHAAEEASHVELWLQFARATGWCGANGWFYGEDPYDESVACSRVWAGDRTRSLPEHLVTLYAIESAQPAISRAKVEGLIDHYGFVDGPATEYFRVHADRDHEHARLARTALGRSAQQADPFRLLRQVEAVHRSYWGLLDGLEERAH